MRLVGALIHVIAKEKGKGKGVGERGEKRERKGDTPAR
jgi:hypothetical protein